MTDHSSMWNFSTFCSTTGERRGSARLFCEIADAENVRPVKPRSPHRNRAQVNRRYLTPPNHPAIRPSNREQAYHRMSPNRSLSDRLTRAAEIENESPPGVPVCDIPLSPIDRSADVTMKLLIALVLPLVLLDPPLLSLCARTCPRRCQPTREKE
jgi:hypothetical protein